MKPRDLLTFFKTKSGKLVIFGVAFAGGLVVFNSIRRNGDVSETIISKADTSPTEKPQVIQTVERPLEIYRPPIPKPEAPPRITTSAVVPAVATSTVVAQSPETLHHQMAPISLMTDASLGAPESKGLSPSYAPFGRLISCETVVTVDSSSTRTPIIGLVTEDVYHAGRLVVPAGTEVHGTAQADRHRERIASGTSWILVWQTGEELRLNGIALDREFSNGTDGWGITDGSAGLRGRLIKTDDLAEIKLFTATFLSGAANALTEKEQTLLGTIDSRSLNNAPFKGAEKVLSIYAQRIYEAIQRDGFYVRVASGKQFYIYVLQTIDRADAVIGGASTPFATDSDRESESGRTGLTAGPGSIYNESLPFSKVSHPIEP